MWKLHFSSRKNTERSSSDRNHIKTEDNFFQNYKKRNWKKKNNFLELKLRLTGQISKWLKMKFSIAGKKEKFLNRSNWNENVNVENARLLWNCSRDAAVLLLWSFAFFAGQINILSAIILKEEGERNIKWLSFALINIIKRDICHTQLVGKEPVTRTFTHLHLSRDDVGQLMCVALALTLNF